MQRRRVMLATGKKREYILRNGVLQSSAGGVDFIFTSVTSGSRANTKYTAGSGIFLSMLGSSGTAWPRVRMIIRNTFNTDGRKIGIRLVNSGWPTSGVDNRGGLLYVAKQRPSDNVVYPRFYGPDENGSFERLWPISDITGNYQPGNNYLAYWIWGYGNTNTYQTLITDLWLE